MIYFKFYPALPAGTEHFLIFKMFCFLKPCSFFLFEYIGQERELSINKPISQFNPAGDENIQKGVCKLPWKLKR